MYALKMAAAEGLSPSAHLRLSKNDRGRDPDYRQMGQADASSEGLQQRGQGQSGLYNKPEIFERSARCIASMLCGILRSRERARRALCASAVDGSLYSESNSWLDLNGSWTCTLRDQVADAMSSGNAENELLYWNRQAVLHKQALIHAFLKNHTAASGAVLPCRAAPRRKRRKKDSSKLQIVCNEFPGLRLCARDGRGQGADKASDKARRGGALIRACARGKIVAIQESDLFICNGGESEAWVESLVSDDVNVLRMMDCVETLAESSEGIYAADHDHEHEDEHDHDHEEEA